MRTFSILIFAALLSGLLVPALAQDPVDSATKEEPSRFAFTAESAVVTKYMWRGLRLTNDWSWQPSGTLQLAGFSFGVWGNMDLTAANEGDRLYLPRNPEAPSGDCHGMRGRFSEVDYLLSYSRDIGKVNLTGAAALYAFPGRSASIPATTEVSGSVSFPEVLLAPSATVYIDVDESRALGPTAVYLELGAGHSIPLDDPRFSAVELGAKLGIANQGFAGYYHEERIAGPHDINLTASVPISLGAHVSAKVFLCYSALLGKFREMQYPDLRDVYLGNNTLGGADTVWGGASVGFEF